MERYIVGLGEALWDETSAKPYPFSIILVFEHYWLTCSLYF